MFLKSFGILEDIGGTFPVGFQLGNLLSESAFDLDPVKLSASIWAEAALGFSLMS